MDNDRSGFVDFEEAGFKGVVPNGKTPRCPSCGKNRFAINYSSEQVKCKNCGLVMSLSMFEQFLANS